VHEGRQVVSSVAAVATGTKEGARAGARMFMLGGNAMDAAAAASIACAVAEPSAVDVGGYLCCAVVLEGRTGRIWSLDGNATAPASARENMFRYISFQQSKSTFYNELEHLGAVENEANLFGPLSVAVPGFLAGVGTLSERWGRLKWSQVVEPAQTLLEENRQYGSQTEPIQEMSEVIARFPSTAEYLLPAGKVPEPTDAWSRPHLQQTLDRVSRAGWRDFYEGEIGRNIADFVASAGGILGREDMARFAPRITECYSTTYHGASVYSAILPNGGLTALEILNLLEQVGPPASGTAEYWRELAKMLQRAWDDRLRYLGDPDFADVPVDKLLSKEYAAKRVKEGVTTEAGGASPHGTIHVSAADREGNLVAVTISQGGSFGSCLAVPKTGIILGHGMSRFDPRPGRPNSVAPGKRPLNNTSPLIVRMPDRDVGIGARGGRRLLSVCARMVQRIVDDGVELLEAACQPRMHALPDGSIEVDRIEPSLVNQVSTSGFDVRINPKIAGAAHGAEIRKDHAEIRAGGNVWAVGM
jgi:gamma-glutamyltranspeptidase/glutathione hydrolase